MELLGAIVAATITPLWHPISRQIGYIKDLHRNLDALKREKEELKRTRDEVQAEVRRAVSSGKRPVQRVQDWLNEADSYIEQIDSITSEVEGGRSRCCCSDLNSRRRLGKRIPSLKNEVERHKDICRDFMPQMREVAQSPDREEMHVPREFAEQGSSKEAVGKILQWLEDEEIGVICVWGMGGVGKTTLVKQLCNKLKGTNDFDQVIWVTVSKDRNLEAIRQRIANRLKLKFEANEGIEDKQERLRARLNEVRSILILDDLWQKLSLEEVGIPPPNNKKNRCKIVLTTRNYEVCDAMEADREFKIEPLKSEEAWTLFCSKTGDISPEIRPLAEEVLRECCGLPLAIVTVGCSMRRKADKEEWQRALNALSTTDLRFSRIPMEKEVFHPLKLSYDSLDNPQLKSCFLDCALYPEDYPIDVEQLVNLWAFGEGLANNAGTLDAARNEGHSIVEKLTDACLLEKDNMYDDGFKIVQMHDLIRDLALWITSPASSSSFPGQKFLVKAGVRLTQPPEEKHWEGMAKISLMQNQLNEIQVMPNCPDLVSLLLSDNDQLHTIGDRFFESMPKLQILDLSSTDIESLPSLSLLVNLRFLNVSYCRKLHTVGDRFFESMPKLEILALSYADIESLPSSSLLVNLRVLDVSNCSKLHTIGDRFFESMPKLQSLDLSSTGIESLPSLSRLVNLRVLNVRNCSRLKAIPPLGDLKELEFLDLYDTCIMNWPGGIRNLSKLKFLSVATGTDILGRIPLNEFSKLTNLDDLRLLCTNGEEKVNGRVNVDTLREVVALPRLTSLQIHLLPVFDAFTTDAMNHQIWSHLTRYTVYASYDFFDEGFMCDDFDYYCDEDDFSKMVYIKSCEIFHGQINCLRYAEGLKMEKCKGLQTLSQIIGESETLKWIELNEVEAMKCVIDWREMGNDNAILGDLETLVVDGLTSLERVFSSAPGQQMTASVGQLVEICVFECPKLTCIFSCTMLQHLHQLKRLRVCACKQLAEIVEGGPFPDRAQLKLTELGLVDLPKLTTICRQHLDFTSDLTLLQIEECPLLKKLPNLKER